MIRECCIPKRRPDGAAFERTLDLGFVPKAVCNSIQARRASEWIWISRLASVIHSLARRARMSLRQSLVEYVTSLVVLGQVESSVF